MGRLVDVDEVIKAVDKHTKDEAEIVLDNDITCTLEEVPTAYDVDTVVADIRRSSGNGYRDIDGDWVSPMIKTKNAIDIVKRGGV